MNVLLSCIGKRGYIADYFRPHLRSGERILGTSNSPWTPGFMACDQGFVLPAITSDEYVPAVLDLCRRNEVGTILSFYDPDVMALSGHLEALRREGVTPFLPEKNAARIAFDKWRTFLTLRDQGFDVPETTVDLADALARVARGTLCFPLIVKPRQGFGSADVFVARNEQQLIAFFGHSSGMLIQSFVQGETFDVEVLSDPHGRVLHAVAWKKILSRMGETEHAITVEDEAMITVGQRLAECVGLVGPMDVDLIKTPDGRIVVLELNLRFGGGYPVSHLAGADFPGLIMDVLRGREPQARVGMYQRDVVLLKGLHVMGGEVGPFVSDLTSRGAPEKGRPLGQP